MGLLGYIDGREEDEREMEIIWLKFQLWGRGMYPAKPSFWGLTRLPASYFGGICERPMGTHTAPLFVDTDVLSSASDVLDSMCLLSIRIEDEVSPDEGGGKCAERAMVAFGGK